MPSFREIEITCHFAKLDTDMAAAHHMSWCAVGAWWSVLISTNAATFGASEEKEGADADAEEEEEAAAAAAAAAEAEEEGEGADAGAEEEEEAAAAAAWSKTAGA